MNSQYLAYATGLSIIEEPRNLSGIEDVESMVRHLGITHALLPYVVAVPQEMPRKIGSYKLQTFVPNWVPSRDPARLQAQISSARAARRVGFIYFSKERDSGTAESFLDALKVAPLQLPPHFARTFDLTFQTAVLIVPAPGTGSPYSADDFKVLESYLRSGGEVILVGKSARESYTESKDPVADLFECTIDFSEFSSPNLFDHVETGNAECVPVSKITEIRVHETADRLGARFRFFKWKRVDMQNLRANADGENVSEQLGILIHHLLIPHRE
jgi:hypothetical protein